jgi:hypothetical protein
MEIFWGVLMVVMLVILLMQERRIRELEAEVTDLYWVTSSLEKLVDE